MDLFNKIFSCCCVSIIFLLFAENGFCQQEHDCFADVDDGFALVEEFYSTLFNPKIETSNPDIFGDIVPISPRKTIEDENEFIWNYLKSRRNLFITEQYQNGNPLLPTDFIIQSRKLVSYYKHSRNYQINKKVFFITLMSISSRKRGEWKEISFLIDCETKPCKLEFSNIKINGKQIDPYSFFED